MEDLEKAAEGMRLQKYIASCGIAARRKAEDMIVAGRVTVNGQTVRELGTKVFPEDRVTVDGTPIEPVQTKYYIMLNKPAGYITSSEDERGRATVMDLVKGDIPVKLHSVGRLDYDTDGLLFLTNDGDFTYRLTHPRHEVKKKYLVILRGDITVTALCALRRGVKIDDYVTAPAEAELVDVAAKGYSSVEVTIHEGKNRQVRRMFEALGYDISYLQRLSVGNVSLGNLKIGKWRHLTSHEINCLKGM